MLRIEAGFVLFTQELRVPVAPRELGLEQFARPTDAPEPEIRLVSFRAEADHLSWPWQPPLVLQRPSQPGSIAVTSACESVAAGGILGLGYVLAGTLPDTPLQDSTDTFRNVRITAKPFTTLPNNGTARFGVSRAANMPGSRRHHSQGRIYNSWCIFDWLQAKAPHALAIESG
jgi:glycine cleavage system aminomethyltransferase T